MSDLDGTSGDERTYKHWATVIGEEAITKFGKSQTVATGWSPSGYYHIGNFREGVTCRAIAKELENLGAKTRFILNVDDVDPFDKVPVFFKKDYEHILKPYLNQPISEVIDPLGCHSSYAEHFTANAMEMMNAFDVSPEAVKTSDEYKKGSYNKYAILMLEKKEEIAHITETITGTRMEELFLIQCPNCKNLAAPTLLDYSIENSRVIVSIDCKKEKSGCGQKNQFTLGETIWKLKWRLDWAARQDFLNVTVEDSGKDHGVAGGSIDTSIAIHKQIFNKEPPILPTHGFITFGGKKLSGSAGSGIPVSEFPNILEPETFLYKIYRNNIRRDFDFNVAMDVPATAAEFDKAEEMFYQEMDMEHKKTVEKTIKAYELAIIEKTEKKPFRVDYGYTATVAQVFQFDRNRALNHLKKPGSIPDNLSEKEIKNLNLRLDQAIHWLKNYADDKIKFEILKQPNCDLISKENKQELEYLIEVVKSIPESLKGDEITQYVYESSTKYNVKPKNFFAWLYLVILGKRVGPRAGTLIEAIGKNEIIQKLEQALSCF